MAGALAGVDAKLRRARQHLNDFKGAEAALMDVPPYEVEVVELDHDEYEAQIPPVRLDRSMRYFKTLCRRVDPVPELLALQVGDFANNLRATLDHLAWQLILLNKGEPDEHTAFPIFDSRTYIDRRSAKTKTRRVRIVGARGEASATALKLVEAAQPYHRGASANEHPLWVLRQLNNVDKHRLLLVLVAATSHVHIYLTGEYGFAGGGGGGRGPGFPRVPGETFRYIPLSPDTDLGLVGVQRGNLGDGPVEMESDMAPRVAFGEREEVLALQPVAEALQTLTQAVSDVIDTFRPLFA